LEKSLGTGWSLKKRKMDLFGIGFWYGFFWFCFWWVGRVGCSVILLPLVGWRNIAGDK